MLSSLGVFFEDFLQKIEISEDPRGLRMP